MERDGIGPYDLLLLKLPYELTLDENVNVACLPESTDTVEAGTRCVVSGFGREHYRGSEFLTFSKMHFHMKKVYSVQNIVKTFLMYTRRRRHQFLQHLKEPYYHNIKAGQCFQLS